MWQRSRWNGRVLAGVLVGLALVALLGESAGLSRDGRFVVSTAIFVFGIALFLYGVRASKL